MAELRERSGRFSPGTSGNPGGRPAGVSGIRELARESGPEAIETLKSLMKSQDERVRLAAAVALLDRGFGKPTQPLDHEIQQSNPNRPAREKTNAELHAELAPVARALLRRVLGDKVDEMDDESLVTQALPLIERVYRPDRQVPGE